MTTTVVQGRTVTLTVEWRAYPGGPLTAVTGVTITAQPLAGGAAVLGPTSTGVSNPAVGINAYPWVTSGTLPTGDYLVTWSGTDAQADAVTATEIITVLGGPADVYATLAELKFDRRRTDTDDDASLLKRLASASRAIDKKTGRRFWLDDVATARVFNPRGRVVRSRDGEQLLVDDIGSLTDLAVEIGAGSSWTAITDYETQPDNALAEDRPITGLLRLGCWSFGATRVRITARWGWPTVPAEISEATLLLASRLFLRKDSPEGVAGSNEWGQIRLSRFDPDVENLVSPYVLLGFA